MSKFLYSNLKLKKSCVIFLVFFSSESYALDKDIHFWIKAFIPSYDASKSSTITRTKMGVSVIATPNIPIPNTLPAKLHHFLLNGCFSTDNRGFSTDPRASARATTEFLIKIRGKRHNITLEKVADRNMDRHNNTYLMDCSTGKINVTKKARSNSEIDKLNLSIGTKKSLYSSKISEVKMDGLSRVFYVSMSVGDPFYVNVPKLDYSMSFRYDALREKLVVNGSIGTFPAFEAYIKVDGVVHKVLSYMPSPKTGPFSLIDMGLGINTQNFSYELTL